MFWVIYHIISQCICYFIYFTLYLYIWSCLLTSHHDGGGLLGRVSHVVAGHAAVDPRLVRGDGRERERAPLHHAPLRQAVIAADPGESRGRLSARGDAHQGHRLARIHHDRILHQQLDGRGGCGGRGAQSIRKIGRRWRTLAVMTVSVYVSWEFPRLAHIH